MYFKGGLFDADPAIAKSRHLIYMQPARPSLQYKCFSDHNNKMYLPFVKEVRIVGHINASFKKNLLLQYLWLSTYLANSDSTMDSISLVPKQRLRATMAARGSWVTSLYVLHVFRSVTSDIRQERSIFFSKCLSRNSANAFSCVRDFQMFTWNVEKIFQFK